MQQAQAHEAAVLAALSATDARTLKRILRRLIEQHARDAELASLSRGSGSISASPSLLLRLTLRDTGQACMPAGSVGASNGASAATSCCSRFSQASQCSRGRITGMRSWIGAMSALAAVVMMQQVSSHSASSAEPAGRQASNSPAKANSGSHPSALRGLMYQGCLPLGVACHS